MREGPGKWREVGVLPPNVSTVEGAAEVFEAKPVGRKGGEACTAVVPRLIAED